MSAKLWGLHALLDAQHFAQRPTDASASAVRRLGSASQISQPRGKGSSPPLWWHLAGYCPSPAKCRLAAIQNRAISAIQFAIALDEDEHLIFSIR